MGWWIAVLLTEKSMLEGLHDYVFLDHSRKYNRLKVLGAHEEGVALSSGQHRWSQWHPVSSNDVECVQVQNRNDKIDAPSRTLRSGAMRHLDTVLINLPLYVLPDTALFERFIPKNLANMYKTVLIVFPSFRAWAATRFNDLLQKGYREKTVFSNGNLDVRQKICFYLPIILGNIDAFPARRRLHIAT